MWKRYLSIFLSFLLTLVSVCPISAMESKNDKKNESQPNELKAMEFYNKSSNLVRKYWNKNYFESIKLKVGEYYLIADDSDKKVELSNKVYMKDDVIMIPIDDIIDFTGGNIDQNDENIQINYSGNNVELEGDSNKIEINGKVKSIVGKVTLNDDNVMAPIEVLSKGLGYTYKYNKKSKEIELTSPYQTMRLIVKLKYNNVNLSKYNPVETVEGLDNVFVLQFDSIEDTKLAYEQIQKDKIAVYVEPDYYISGYSMGKISSSDASSTYNSWGVKYIEADKYATHLQKQDITRTITVGVVDTGIDYNHSIFSNRIKSGGYDFVNSDSYPYDDNGHGTHVSGTVVDCTPGLSINILPIKVLDYDGSGTSLGVANGIQYAANKGVDVINLSLGSTYDSTYHWYYMHNVIDNAIENDVVVVAAAGNDNINTKYECPADMSNAIVVSAIDSWGDKCYFSNYGSSVDVAAPGEFIYSAYPGGGYAYMDGTSMAAPHISAVCAMYRLKYPNLSVYEVEELVQKNTKDLGVSGWDMYYGSGVPRLSLDISAKFGWVYQNGKWYYYNQYGNMHKGWLNLDGIWYYFRSNGEMSTGWVLVDNKWYYFENSGEMRTGWLKLNGAWYYFENSGEMKTGWLNLNGTWYYLNSSGEMKTGWLNLNGTWYYLNSSGEMKTGWLNLNGTWYYLNSSGEMKTGWLNLNGTWYYMYGSGKMAINTIIDEWKIDENGVATPIK